MTTEQPERRPGRTHQPKTTAKILPTEASSGTSKPHAIMDPRIQTTG
jgi:hypothetical protein